MSRRVIDVMLSLAAAFVLIAVCACPSHAWWDDKWQHRKKITFDTSSKGADIDETLNDVPVLIRLHGGNFDFANAKADGSDIRFISADDKMPLKFQKEAFDPLLEIGLFWVRIPRLPSSSNSESIWVYYGNDKAVGGEDRGSTFNVSQVAVYHFDEADGSPKDATAYGNNTSGFDKGPRIQAIIGNGVAFTGSGEKIVIRRSPSLSFSDGFSFSTWIKIAQPQSDAYILSWGDENQGLVAGVNGVKPYFRVKAAAKEIYETPKDFDLSLDVWHHLLIAAKPNEKMIVYVDGAEAASAALPSKIPEPTSDIGIGATLAGQHALTGELDEARLAKVALPAVLPKLAFRGEGPDGNLYSVTDEEAESGHVSEAIIYLRIITKAISLDGWLIISVLIAFGTFAGFIFLWKSYLLSITSRENRMFLESFRGLKDLTALYTNGVNAGSVESSTADEDDPGSEDDEDDGNGRYRFSSLYNIYAAGMEDLSIWLADKDAAASKAQIPPIVLRSFNSAVERAFVAEDLKLNDWINLMTMAITGGPFLGLLGTVWGVMNTFAAMAEAGEANLVAIAPGVASALATTVFGLLVAIPALFGYNYLVARIKVISNNLSLFADELTIKVEKRYGGAE